MKTVHNLNEAKLIGSDSSIESLLKGIINYFCGTDIKLVGTTDLYHLENSSGRIDGFRVIKRGKRFRFEFVGGAK